MLEQLATDVGQPAGRTNILSTEERDRLIVDYNNTAAPIPPTSLPTLFETQAHTTPETVDVVFENTTLTYTQLNTKPTSSPMH